MENRTLYLLFGLAAAVGLFLYSRTKQGASVVSEIATAVGDFVTNRGLRDNNPGNIRRSATDWQGEASRAEWEAQGGKYDPEFEQFFTVASGVRALGRILTTYSNKYSLRSVRGIISRYAPPAENDTEDYIAEVCAALHVGDTQQIDVHTFLPELATAIMRRETGFSADPVDITAWVYS